MPRINRVCQPEQFILPWVAFFLSVFCLSTASESSQCAENIKVNQVNTVETVEATCVIVTDGDQQCSLKTDGLFVQADGQNVTALSRNDLNNTAVLFKLDRKYRDSSVECHAGRLASEVTIQPPPVPPTKPDSISCIAYNMQTMNCTWQPVEDNTNYTLMYQVYSLSPGHGRMHECPHYNKNSCHWGGSDSRIRDYYYKIRVTAKRPPSFIVHSDNVTINCNQIAKLNSVKDLKSISIEPTSFVVQWGEPIPAYWQELVRYKIHVKSQWDTEQIFYRETHDHTIEYEVKDLIPHTMYTVSVTCIIPETLDANPNDSTFFSQPQLLKVTTQSTVPDIAPVVTPGGFSVSNSDVEIFWQPIHKDKYYGRDARARVRGFLRPDPTERPSCSGTADRIVEVPPDKNTARVSKVPVGGNISVDFCVDFGNSLGYNDSIQLQPIRISAFVWSYPKFYVVGTMSEVTVHLLEDHNSTGQTIYWSDSGNIQFINHFRWEPLTEPVTRLTAVNINNAVVGMSAEYRDTSDILVSSGIKLAHHVYDAAKDIQKPQNLWVDESLSKPTTLLLKWDKIDYRETAYINHFNLSYCRQDLCQETTVTEKVDGTSQAYIVSGLEPEQTYEFRMKSVGDGMISDYTDTVTGVVPSEGLQKKYLIMIGVLGGVCAILVVAGVYTIVRCCQKRVRDFRRPIEIVEVPDVTEMYAEQNGNKTTSDNHYMDVDVGNGKVSYSHGNTAPPPVAATTATNQPTPNSNVGDTPVDTGKNEQMPLPTEQMALLHKMDHADSGHSSIFNSSGKPLLVR